MCDSRQDQIEAVCERMEASLASYPNNGHGFCDLAATVLAERRARLLAPNHKQSLPWLLLPIFAYQALGDGQYLQEAQQVAAAWELGNMAATHLDAWQDRDTDGALWQRIGPEKTMNVVIGLLDLSNRSLSILEDSERLPRPVERCLRWGFEETLMRMLQGQHADLGDDLRLEDYAAVVAVKTGSLFRLACWSGVVVAGAEPDVTERYGAFGEALGLTIQAWNDLYGLQGALGKRDVGHQRTLPILASLAMMDGQASPGEAPEAGSAEQGGQLFALLQAGLLHQQAAEALAQCPQPGRLTYFLDAYAVERFVPGDAQGHD